MDRPYLLVKIGKHQYFKVDILKWLAYITKKSNAEMKRLWQEDAIDLSYKCGEGGD